jgi:phenylacetate-CoA ligase
MIFQPELETLSRERLEKLQDERLRFVVGYVYERVPFYRQRLDEAGVDPKAFGGLKDLHKLPFTRKDHLRENYPFGLFAVPREEVARIHASSGTTGKPTVVGYTKKTSRSSPRWWPAPWRRRGPGRG